MSFSSLVERLILKKTSLLLSATLMFKCSALAASAGGGVAPFSDIVFAGCCLDADGEIRG